MLVKSTFGRAARRLRQYERWAERERTFDVECWINSPAPHSGVGGTAFVFPKSPVMEYFSPNKVWSVLTYTHQR